MPPKPKRKKLPKPSVFKNASTEQWVCEYYEFDDKGQPKARRKSFVRELKKQGMEPSLAEQRKAALAFEKDLLKERQQNERLERREREQTHLTPQQLREAKAAFAIFDQIPDRNKSLVDAVMLYRDHLKLAVDSPSLNDCIGIFLGRKKEASETGRLSPETSRTLRQRLNNFKAYFAQKHPGIKIGEVTARLLIDYFESMDIGERTLRNYVTDVANFFNDAADPKDELRFINQNPMDGVYVHFRKYNKSKALKTNGNERKTPKILQIEETMRALSIAYAQRKHGILGFTVCGLFLGMRPSEVFDLAKQPDHWERYIKLDEGIVRIDGFGKKRDQRTIVMPDNAKAWLEFIKNEGLPICFHYNPNGRSLRYANFRALAYLPEGDGERLIQFRRKIKEGHTATTEEAEFAESCRKRLAEFEDVLRHTFGSNYYYANGYDKNKTIEQMGHSGEVFVEHYRGLLDRPNDHEAYFSLTPVSIETDVR